MIMEIRSRVDNPKKCGNCKFFKTKDGIYGECICSENKIKSWNRFRKYNDKACTRKETRNDN